MAKMPRRLKVGHQVITLERADLDGDLGIFYDGANGEPNKIQLATRLSGQELARVALHEVFHAIIHGYVPIETFNRVIRAKRPDREDIEEVFCDALGKGMAQVWRDNRAFATWINSLLRS